jgi:hypothetical protein
MNKRDSIVGSVTAQLTVDHWWPPMDDNKTMGGDYLYDSNGMAIFLKKIQSRLATASPAYYFSFDQPFADSCLPLAAPQLMAKIDGKTGDTPSQSWSI